MYFSVCVMEVPAHKYILKTFPAQYLVFAFLRKWKNFSICKTLPNRQNMPVENPSQVSHTSYFTLDLAFKCQTAFNKFFENQNFHKTVGVLCCTTKKIQHDFFHFLDTIFGFLVLREAEKLCLRRRQEGLLVSLEKVEKTKSHYELSPQCNKIPLHMKSIKLEQPSLHPQRVFYPRLISLH